MGAKWAIRIFRIGSILACDCALCFGRMRAITAPVPWRPRGGSQSGARARETRPPLPEGLHGQPMLVGFPSPRRSDQTPSVRAEITFPAHSFVPRPEFRLVPVLSFWITPFRISTILGLFCRGDAVAPVDNNRRYFGMTAEFSRPNNCEKETVPKRSRRCKNGYCHVARSLVAPKPGVVSKIGGKMGNSYI